MALVKMVPGFEALSGRFGQGTNVLVGMPTKSPGKSLYTFRARANFTPENPQTAYQNQIRAWLAAASQAYQAITIVQSDAWESLGALMKISGPLGTEHGLTAGQMYNRVNLFRLIDGQAQTAVAPAYEDPGNCDDLIVENNTVSTKLDITITHSLATTGFWAIRVTPALPSTVRKARQNELRYIDDTWADNIVALAASPQTVSLDQDKFSLSAPDTCGVEVIHLNADYLPSAPIFFRRKVVADTP